MDIEFVYMPDKHMWYATNGCHRLGSVLYNSQTGRFFPEYQDSEGRLVVYCGMHGMSALDDAQNWIRQGLQAEAENA